MIDRRISWFSKKAVEHLNISRKDNESLKIIGQSILVQLICLIPKWKDSSSLDLSPWSYQLIDHLNATQRMPHLRKLQIRN